MRRSIIFQDNNQPMANSQTIEPGLYIVATPIGNLSDITLRALDVLRAADLIACEDTRTSAKLLSHYGIKARTRSYHDHNAESALPQLLQELQSGKIVALISDAGTPLISDPGYRLVREAGLAGIRVIPIPGASSSIAALSVCGLPTDRFLFCGFLPAKMQARAKEIAELAVIPATLVFFESARRLPEALAELAQQLGEREAVIARELTKLHEELRRGTLPELADYYAEAGEPKGEVVIVVAPPLPAEAPAAEDVEALLSEALQTMRVKDAAAHVAKATGLPRQELYAKALQLRPEKP
ncbi:MAG TPA: 16S rRNA (cytidine(1402)-2'-O)-methyltransferase [Rickettsiales bacterium]|nr:16S rRNA (cytidine(1402)-2'-O)-methyltransferase [Rickettsiales bacterium]